MTFNFAMLDLVDERIAAAKDRATAVGTMTERTTATRALVTFDGSAVAVPVKMFSDVLALAGDRVGLVRFGTDWVVVGGFAADAVGVYVDYSSTFTFTGSTGAPTKGTSVYDAQYMWINRSLVRVRIRLDLLTGFVQGTGVVTMSLPFAASAESIRAEVGAWWLDDSGVAERAGSVVCRDANSVHLFSDGAGGPMSFGGTPFDLADKAMVTFTYEPA